MEVCSRVSVAAPGLVGAPLPVAPAHAAWHCLHTKSGREKRVAEVCASRAIPYFLPLRKSVRRHQGRRWVFHVPLFPGYLFCVADAEQRYGLLRTNHLARAIEVADQEGLLGDQRHIAVALERGEGREVGPHSTSAQPYSWKG